MVSGSSVTANQTEENTEQDVHKLQNSNATVYNSFPLPHLSCLANDPSTATIGRLSTLRVSAYRRLPATGTYQCWKQAGESLSKKLK